MENLEKADTAEVKKDADNRTPCSIQVKWFPPLGALLISVAMYGAQSFQRRSASQLIAASV